MASMRRAFSYEWHKLYNVLMLRPRKLTKPIKTSNTNSIMILIGYFVKKQSLS
jgi:hypothetical protein